MPKPPVPSAVDEFLRRPNPAVIASLMPDGAPHSAATWYLWENGRALVNMASPRKRLDSLRRDGRVSLPALWEDGWYRHVTLAGHVAAVDPDPGLRDIDRLAQHYTGKPYRARDQERFSAWIEVQRWHAWDGGRPWPPPEER